MAEEIKEKPKRGRKPKVKEAPAVGEGKDMPEAKNSADSKKRKVEKVEAELVDEGGKKKRGGVGGNGNLIPLDRLTKEQQREICSKGGVASAAAKKRKKELREFTRDFLMQDASAVLKGNMAQLGVDAEQMTNLAAMIVRLFSKAVNQGDLNAARTIIEWAGMAPLQQERENEAIAKMAQVMQLASGESEVNEDDREDVVFYIPENGRAIVTEAKE